MVTSHSIEVNMIHTEEQELIDQIERLDSELRAYKKAIANPAPWIDTTILAVTMERLEEEISDLKAQLEVHQLISLMFDSVSSLSSD